MRRLWLTTLLLCSLFSPFVHANIATLSQDSQWLSLLHFDRETPFSPPRSAVIDSAFFLAENGRYDPQAELEATLAALREPPDEPGSHASCRFPARAVWLSTKTGEQWPSAECPEFDEWQAQHQDSEIGLMFATGYLGNPASFFGHVMLHSSAPKTQSSSTNTQYLLDTSLNFGADVPNDEGLVTYMAKGLFGGYDAQFSNASFYRNTALYSEREMRDLWHYQLGLTDAEKSLLTAHLFEIVGKDYEYLFLSQNCASRIARTLELVIEDDLTPGYSPWVAPENLLRALSNTTHHGKPLLVETQQIPSRRLTTQREFNALNSHQQRAANAVWPSENDLRMDAPLFTVLSAAQRSEVLDTLLSHASFLRQTGDIEKLPEIERQLLQARLSLPTGRADVSNEAMPAIHEVTPPSLVSFSGVHNSHSNNGARLRFRPLQYDLLDTNQARMPNSAVEIATVEINTNDQGVSLNRLGLFNITNLHTNAIALPTLPSTAWQISAGIERNRLSCRRCFDGIANVLGGKSWALGQHLPYALAGAQLRTQRHYDGIAVPMLEAGVVSSWSPSQRTHIQLSHRPNMGYNNRQRTEWQVQHRIALSTQWDMRFEFQHDYSANEASIGLSRYF
ncbi:DUF4105 domain-containing protein [Halomonas sp. QHL1]|uniref:Lnb N-terminal periplasmic domain-containing protein n=1 Tax=Halomonas sp. QHL1 TaxID=1123773 RepID=UPI0008FD7CC5|nr:DUF4105 domain-containing protein [Halomonas sp. QHL1]OJA05172.1 hypothetical protein QHL1GM_07090 [Halomonas sp. QHL1]